MNTYGINLLSRIGIETTPIGKTLPIEIIKKLDENTSLIKFNGIEINAKLEADVKEGDRFFARVQSLEDGLLILEKLKVNTSKDVRTNADPKDPVRLFVPIEQLGEGLLSSKLPTNPESVELLTQAAIQGSEQITPEKIEQFIKKLGLDYEKLLLELMKKDNNKLSIKENNQVLQEINNTIKAKALNNLNTNDLVQWLTQQQFLLNQGEHNQFMLLFLLIQQGEQLKQFRVATLSPRKQNATENKVYRIGLTATSEKLGEIGVEARIYDHSLSLQVLTDQPDTLKDLIELTKSETIHSFQKAGFQLIGIEVLSLQKAKDFKSFMEGQVPTEVDIWV